MSVEKIVENGVTYAVHTTETSVVKMQAEPALRYAELSRTAAFGDVVTIPLHLEDFDGERRHDTRAVTFVIQGELVELPLTDGALTLELELTARGRQRIASATPTIGMKPIEIEVL
jgi:hypothetical protein